MRAGEMARFARSDGIPQPFGLPFFITTAATAVIQSPVGRYKLARVWSRGSGVTPGGLYQNIGEPRQGWHNASH